jgi:hypothetical protein
MVKICSEKIEFSNGGDVCLFVKKSDSFAVNVIESNTNLELVEVINSSRRIT